MVCFSTVIEKDTDLKIDHWAPMRGLKEVLERFWWTSGSSKRFLEVSWAHWRVSGELGGCRGVSKISREFLEVVEGFKKKSSELRETSKRFAGMCGISVELWGWRVEVNRNFRGFRGVSHGRFRRSFRESFKGVSGDFREYQRITLAAS